MGRRFDVKITLLSQLKKCPAGHRVGDEFIVGRHTPAGICLGAFGSMLPYITTLRCGGSFPWEKSSNSGIFCCPDPKVVNTFRLERLESSGTIIETTDSEHC